jgi:hypothetical protein
MLKKSAAVALLAAALSAAGWMHRHLLGECD